MPDQPTPADGDLRARYAAAAANWALIYPLANYGILSAADDDSALGEIAHRLAVRWGADIADAMAAVRDTELERLRAEQVKAERKVGHHNEVANTALRAWEAMKADADRERQRAEQAEAERDALKAALAVHTGCRRDLSIGDLLRSASAPEKPGWLTWEKLMGTPAPETPAVLTDAPESPCSLCGGTGIVPGNDGFRYEPENPEDTDG